jgi:hypothetical protein
MKSVVNLLARNAMIARFSSLSLSREAVKRLCKLESHGLLSNPFIPQKEVTVHDLPVADRPLQQCNGFGMS